MRWLSTPTLSVAASLICFVSSSPVAHSVDGARNFPTSSNIANLRMFARTRRIGKDSPSA